MKSKSLYIRTFGCQMNARDSEFVAGMLVDSGFKLVDSVEKADVIIFNSCAVRKHAEEKLFSNISEAGRLKKTRQGSVLVLMGCVAQSYKDKAIKRVPAIDIVCGPGNEADLPILIDNVIKHRCSLVATDKVSEKRPELFPKYREGLVKANVSIGEGCDNFCSYCVVPYVRGRERSRSVKDIVREVRGLAARGFKEVTLLGQNVNSYSDKEHDFVRLLEGVNKIDGIERIRFMTSHPKDAHAELFKVMTGLEKVCEHLHLPLQSGSDRILKLMNRKYTAKRYLDVIAAYRKYVPHGSLTTDVLVGFPSETERDFKKTHRLMDDVGFDGAYTFQYSPRPPAKSVKFDDDVPPAAKTARLMEAVALQSRWSRLRNDSHIGRTVEVLVEGVSKKESTVLSGRTRTNKTVVFRGPRTPIGRFADVKIMSAGPYTLKGRIVS